MIRPNLLLLTMGVGVVAVWPFDQAVGLLTTGGFHAFLLPESTDLEPFRARVGPVGASHLARRPLKQWSFPNGITVWWYDLADPTPTRG